MIISETGLLNYKIESANLIINTKGVTHHERKIRYLKISTEIDVIFSIKRVRDKKIAKNSPLVD